MEFNEKLQDLRKQKGYTQEDLAQMLHVSRAAVSKWESGRGYPNIDSLKAIAKLFGVSVDSLLSGEQILTIAQKDHQQKENHFRDILFGLLDIAAGMGVILPLFAQKSNEIILSVPLIWATDVSVYLQIVYYVILVTLMLAGIAALCLQNCNNSIWINLKAKISLILTVAGVFIFVISRQPYAAAYLLIFMVIKMFLIFKKK